MKKIYSFFVISLFALLLVGCGEKAENNENKEKEVKNFVCNAIVEDEQQKANVEFTANLDDEDKIKTLDVVFDFDTEEYAQQMVYVLSFINNATDEPEKKIDVKQDGTKVIIKNYEKITDEPSDDDDEDALRNVVGMTKAEFETALKNMKAVSEVSCK